jgi:hypothetical protein
MLIHELIARIPVIVTSSTLPKGMTDTENRKGICLAWCCRQGDNDQWLIVLDETGEMAWVPMPEVRLQSSWSDYRRTDAEIS